MIKPVLLHIHLHWGDYQWVVWRDMEDLKNEIPPTNHSAFSRIQKGLDKLFVKALLMKAMPCVNGLKPFIYRTAIALGCPTCSKIKSATAWIQRGSLFRLGTKSTFSPPISSNSS